VREEGEEEEVEEEEVENHESSRLRISIFSREERRTRKRIRKKKPSYPVLSCPADALSSTPQSSPQSSHDHSTSRSESAEARIWPPYKTKPNQTATMKPSPENCPSRFLLPPSLSLSL
jgi:hypothetical protein